MKTFEKYDHILLPREVTKKIKRQMTHTGEEREKREAPRVWVGISLHALGNERTD